MRKTALIGVSLTLLMLLLVLSGAFIFLFQGRQVLRADRDEAVSVLSQTQQELDVTYDSLENSTELLATAESTNLLLEGQLVDSQQELDVVASALATKEAEASLLAGEQNAILSQPPTIEILSPNESTELLVGESVTYDLFVADVVGVTAVIVSIDNEQLRTYSLLEVPSERIQGEWTPTGVGEVVLGIQASNARTSVLVTQTLQVASATTELVPLSEGPFPLERTAVHDAISEIRLLFPAPLEGITTTYPLTFENEDLTPLIDNTTYDESWAAWNLFDFDQADFVAEDTAVIFQYDEQNDTIAINNTGQTFDALDAYAYADAYTRILLDQTFPNFDNQQISLDRNIALQTLKAADVSAVLNGLLASDFFSADDVERIRAGQQNLAFFEWLGRSGQEFVALLADENNSSLNNAWVELPISSEQVLHPEKYLFDEAPIVVELPDLRPLLGDSWEIIAEETLGEGLLRYHLRRHLNEMQLETAASGWGGDQFRVLQNEDGENLLVLKIVWDTLEDSNEFAALYPNYPTKLFTAAGTLNDRGECWQGEEVICLFQNQEETIIIRAPILETAISVGTFLSN